WLTWPPHVTPEFVIGFEVTPPDEIISRRLGRNVLNHLDSCLLNSLGHGFAAAEEHRAQRQAPCQHKLNRAHHSLNEHFLSQVYATRNCNSIRQSFNKMENCLRFARR